ncbi:hypothetical protein CARUB_v10023884mg, partial [Capsella rubella]
YHSTSLTLPFTLPTTHTLSSLSSPMAAITGFSALSIPISSPPSLPASRLLNSTRCFSRFSNLSPFPAFSNSPRRKIRLITACSSTGDRGEEVESRAENEIKETLMLSVSPLPLLLVATLPGAATVSSVIGPFAEIVKSLNLPDWLVHWGHPGNMAVVLFAMGGYGTYLGFRIRFSDDIVSLFNQIFWLLYYKDCFCLKSVVCP